MPDGVTVQDLGVFSGSAKMATIPQVFSGLEMMQSMTIEEGNPVSVRSLLHRS